MTLTRIGRTLALALLFTALAVTGGAGPALAQYPAKAVELIVPFPAGGRTDIVARQFAAVASKHLGQQMVVVNRTGGGGAVGTLAVLRAEPDGHTLLATTIGNQVLRPLSADVGYKPWDLDAIGQITESTISLVAKADKPWKDLRDLVAEAKQRPNQVSFAANLLLLPHLITALFEDRAGIQLKHVPQQGDAPGITAVLGGHVDLVTASAVGTILPHVKTGALRVLGTFGQKREPALPEVATATEQGYAVTGGPWTGIAAPPKTAPPALAKLREVFMTVMKDPDFGAGLAKLGEQLVVLDHQAFAARWKSDFEQYDRVVKAIKSKP
jgi:tripartite-type tricarboxylate transporter receptor subunit TctC